MGVDFDAIIGHNLAAADVPTLCARFSASAAPELADAIRDYAQAITRHAISQHYNYRESREAPQIADGGLWQYKIEWIGMNIEEVWAKGQYVSLIGPAQLRLFVYRSCCTLIGGPRWSTFLIVREVQHALRRIVFAMSQITDSPTAIYLPDSEWSPASAYDALWEGGDLSSVVALLHQRCGPPATSIEAIYQKQDHYQPDTTSTRAIWSGDGYFIDDFADIRAIEDQ